MMTYFAKQHLLPSNKILYRPERTEQLADPSWWHSYMQPLHHQPSIPSSSIRSPSGSRHRQYKPHFQDLQEDSEEHSEVSNIPTSAPSTICQPLNRKTPPEEGFDPPTRRSRLNRRVKRELSCEESSFRRRIGSSHRQDTCETGENPDNFLNPQEHPSLRIRHHSWRVRPDRMDSANNSQRHLSQRQSDDMGHNKLPHLFE
ncbi:hypothetical protein Aperf_G00000127247 [Anoplocephala perfoliata]